MLFNYRLLARQLAASLSASDESTLRLGGRRIRFLVGFCVFFPVMWLLSVGGMLLDNLLYPGWRRARGRFPVFIVGNFRTGSSFLFRLLARDRTTFTCMKTWEIYFGPSVVQRRLWSGLWAVDRFFGAPLMRTIKSRQERLLGQVQLHRIRLEEPEEDEALFCLSWHTLFTCFFFPMADAGFRYHRFDTALPHATRRRLLAFYRACIQRHLYARRTTAHYLSKNPSATSRIASLLETYPEARFVYLYRDPVEAIPSTMRWFSFAWHYFSSARERYPLRDFIMELTMEWYRYPLELARGATGGSIFFVSYEDLVADPVDTVGRIYAWLGIRIHGDFARALRQEAEEARGHQPDGIGDLGGTGLTEEEIRRRYGEVATACEEAVRASRAGKPVTSRGSPRHSAPLPLPPGWRRTR